MDLSTAAPRFVEALDMEDAGQGSTVTDLGNPRGSGFTCPGINDMNLCARFNRPDFTK